VAVAAVLACSLLGPPELGAQGKKKDKDAKPGSTRAGGPAGGMGMGAGMPRSAMPGMGAGGPGGMAMPGGMPGSSMPGMGAAGGRGKKPATKKSSKTAGKAADGGTGDEQDPTKLPRDYNVPPEPSEVMTTTDEWDEPGPFEGDTPEQRTKDQRVKVARYKDLVQKGELNGEVDKTLISDIIRWRLAQITRKENREKAASLREQIYRDVAQSGTARGARREVRVFMMQSVADQAPELFRYHFVARLNGAILLADLSDLNEVEAEGKNPAIRCVRALRPLVDLVKQKDQPVAVRIWGVKGLMRLAAASDLKPPRGGPGSGRGSG
jgi:hypothetical protein